MKKVYTCRFPRESWQSFPYRWSHILPVMSLADFRRYEKLRMNSYCVLVFPCDERMLKIRPNICVSFRSSCSHSNLHPSFAYLLSRSRKFLIPLPKLPGVNFGFVNFHTSRLMQPNGKSFIRRIMKQKAELTKELAAVWNETCLSNNQLFM